MIMFYFSQCICNKKQNKTNVQKECLREEVQKTCIFASSAVGCYMFNCLEIL